MSKATRVGSATGTPRTSRTTRTIDIEGARPSGAEEPVGAQQTGCYSERWRASGGGTDLPSIAEKRETSGAKTRAATWPCHPRIRGFAASAVMCMRARPLNRTPCCRHLNRSSCARTTAQRGTHRDVTAFAVTTMRGLLVLHDASWHLCPSEIPVAEESDRNENHERREKQLASWDNERRREHQQSDHRQEGGSCEARAAPHEDGGDDVRGAPHQREERGERGGIGSPWPGPPECGVPARPAMRKAPASRI